MKVLAINGSPRKDGNTELLIRKVFEPLQKAGIETELIRIGGKGLRGCIACGKCMEMKNQTCVITNDCVNDIIQKMIKADGLILASPTYYTDVTADIKALIDRAGFVSIANGNLYKHKVGAAVTAVRRAGAIHAFDTMNHFFQINQMFIVGSTYWNMGYGLEPGDVKNDDEGLANMQNLGESMAYLLDKINK